MCEIEGCQNPKIGRKITCDSHRRILSRYSLTFDQLDDLYKKSGNSCEVCKKSGIKLTVDHDHECCSYKGSCGKCVRGLLCAQCNSSLAKFRESPDIIRGAISYLQRDIFDIESIPDECGGWSDKFYSVKWNSYRLGNNRLSYLLSSQNHSCGVCRSVFIDRKFSVDHDHFCCDSEKTCGACVRGLLCQKCNLGLGYAKDDISTLENMIEYVMNLKDGVPHLV